MPYGEYRVYESPNNYIWFQEDTKRAAILLDKIMYAVQKALDENKVPGKEGITLTPEDLAAFSGVGNLQNDH